MAIEEEIIYVIIYANSVWAVVYQLVNDPSPTNCLVELTLTRASAEVTRDTSAGFITGISDGDFFPLTVTAAPI